MHFFILWSSDDQVQHLGFWQSQPWEHNYMLPIVIEFTRGGRRDGPRLLSKGCNHCFGLVIVEFRFIHCHSSFNVISRLLHGQEEIWDFADFWSWESSAYQWWMTMFFYDSGKGCCVKNKKGRSLWNTEWDGSWLTGVVANSDRLSALRQVGWKPF